MAKEEKNKEGLDKNNESSEVVESKNLEVTKHKVLFPFTLDKPYKAGNNIYLPDGKIKDALISNKLIK